MKSITRAFVAIIATAGLIAGCNNGSGGSGPDGPFNPSASLEWKFPSTGLTDWVTYASHVAIVRVAEEAEIAPSKDVLERQEGYIGREVVLEVESILWSAPGTVALPERIPVIDAGWVMREGEKAPLHNSRLEVGRRYLVPLFQERGEYGSLSPAAIEVDGDAIVAEVASGDEWQKGLGSTPLAAVQQSLEFANPDPLASEFADLAPIERAAAVRVARTGSPSWPVDILASVEEDLEREVARESDVTRKADVSDTLALLRAEQAGLRWYQENGKSSP